jgi:hypothetical protein
MVVVKPSIPTGITVQAAGWVMDEEETSSKCEEGLEITT